MLNLIHRIIPSCPIKDSFVIEVLLFTLGLFHQKVSQVMEAGGYPREAEACQNRFQHLYSSYQAASQFNQTCGMRARRRPPFYFKLKSLFGYKETCESSSLGEDISITRINAIEFVLILILYISRLLFLLL